MEKDRRAELVVSRRECGRLGFGGGNSALRSRVSTLQNKVDK
jgi:hypothetical protein